MKWTGHVAWMGSIRNCCSSSLRKPERKGVPRCLIENVREILKFFCERWDVKVSKNVV
jgi:hypothetical protein